MRMTFRARGTHPPAPKAQRLLSPGQRPGYPGPTNRLALKGQNKPARRDLILSSHAPSGANPKCYWGCYPGALPRADESLRLWRAYLEIQKTFGALEHTTRRSRTSQAALHDILLCVTATKKCLAGFPVTCVCPRQEHIYPPHTHKSAPKPRDKGAPQSSDGEEPRHT